MLWVVPLLAYAGMLIGVFMVGKGRSHVAWWFGALAWTGIIGTVFASMFPFLMPSITQPAHSLTVWDSSSSQRTLTWMLGATLIFVPTVIAYTSWAFWVMRGKVKEVDSEHSY